MDDERMVGGTALCAVGIENRLFVVRVGREPVDGFCRHRNEAARVKNADGFCNCLLINCGNGHCASS